MQYFSDGFSCIRFSASQSERERPPRLLEDLRFNDSVRGIFSRPK
jgi:hypothetical protein